MAGTVHQLRPPTAGEDQLRAEYELRVAQERLGAAVLRQVECAQLEGRAVALAAEARRRRKAADQVVQHQLSALRDAAEWVLLERERAADRAGGTER